MRKLLWLILFIPSVAQGLELPAVKEIRLANGMKFLLVVRGSAPIFSAAIRFRVGGMDEESGKTGLAHLMEHMAFKGTARYGEADLARMVESEGGQDFNATTSKDLTSYTVSLPSDRLSFWAELESERIFRPAFRDFDRERNVVMEERRMRVENDPDGKVYERFIQEAFAGTPYGWPTIGTSEDLKNLTESDLREFWRRHYRPDRAIGVLVGRFDPVQAEKVIRKFFGRISSPPHGHDREATVSFNPGVVRLKENAEPRILIGYPKPPLPHRDDYIFDLISEILGEGRSSRLYRSLVEERGLASRLDVYTDAPGSRATNLFVIGLYPLGKVSTEELLQAFDEELKRFLETGPTGRELEKAKNRLLAHLIWGLRTNDGLAYGISYYEALTGSWRYLATYEAQITSVGAEELLETARRSLTDKRVIAILEP